MRKKIVSVLLIFCFCASLLPAGALAVEAPHTHSACGEADCAGHPVGEDGVAVPMEAVEYTAVDSEEDFHNLTPTESYITISGNYYLTKDVTLTKEIRSSGDTNICLNGNTLTSTADGAPASLVLTGGQFNIADCSENKTGKIINTAGKTMAGVVHVQNAGLALYGGTLSGGTHSGNAGCIQLGDASVFDMYGGSIVNSDGKVGGGVLVINQNKPAQPSVFNLYGGTISGNGDGNGNGGGVTLYANAVLNQYGGSIENNTAEMGGGVAIGNLDTPVVYNLYDGKVSGNTATSQYGGVYFPISSADNFQFNMYGGEISGNHSAEMAGGVGASGEMKLYGGSIINNTSGNIGAGLFVSNYVHIKGAPIIKGNTQNGAPSNIVTAGWDNTILVLDGPLEKSGEKMSVQIFYYKTGAFTSGWSTHMAGKDPADYFASDLEGYIIDLDEEGEAQIRAAALSTLSYQTTGGLLTVSGIKEEVDANSAKVYEGAVVTVGPQPDSGTAIESITLTGSDGLDIPLTGNQDGSYSFTMPAGDVELSVLLVPVFAVTLNSSQNGAYNVFDRTVSETALISGALVPAGHEMEISVIPDRGYQLESVTVAKSGDPTENVATETGAGNRVSFVMPDFAVTVTVTFKEKKASGGSTYVITAEAGEGGQISPAGWVLASRGSRCSFTILPEDGYAVADVLVDGESVGAVDSYTFENVNTMHTIKAVFREIGEVTDCLRDESCPIDAFTDARPDTWYHDGVHYALDKGLMIGTGEDRFSPAAVVTRSQIATCLWRLENSPQVNYAMNYTDVVDGRWYTEAVRWVASQGIMLGYDNGRFGPDDPMTREQMVVIFYRYAQYKGYDVSIGENTNILSFADAEDVSEYALPAMQWGCGVGLIEGQDGKLLNPTGGTERAQLATIFMRFCEDIAK